jgi:hypothetical protein
MHQIFACLERFGWTGWIFVGWIDISQVKGLDNVGTLSVPRGSRGWGYAHISGCLGKFRWTG